MKVFLWRCYALVLFTGVRTGGLFTLLLEDPYAPVAVDTLLGLGAVSDIVAEGGFAYIAAGEAGVWVVNTNDVRNPRIVAQLSVPQTPLDQNSVKAVAVSVRSHWLYVAFGAAGLRMVDITNPSQPATVGKYDDWWCEVPGPVRYRPCQVTGVVTCDDNVFVSGRCPGAPRAEIHLLRVYADAPPLKYVGKRICPGYSVELATDGYFVYSASKTLRIWSGSDPGLNLLSEWELQGQVVSLAASDGFVYVACREDDHTVIKLLRVGDPWQVEAVSELHLPYRITDLDCRGPLIVGVSEEGFVHLFWNGLAAGKTGEPPALPRIAHLYPPWPSPAMGFVKIGYRLAIDSEVRLVVFDLRGRVVRTLSKGQRPAGEHRIGWDGTDNTGQPLPSGVYLVRLEAAGQTAVQKVVLVR
ncbi:MAG: T9SS type A sorting domain-containing protein [Calditrichaeota bacterium]|nr:T9SS type A sorting domain-containing protein [Calditrichota bacterium]